MLIIGLTGGIGTGKSTVAGMFEEYKIPVFYADKAAKQALGKIAQTKEAQQMLPEIFDMKNFSREKIADKIFANAEIRKKLEAILHPYILMKITLFIEEYEKKNAPFVVLEVPLLFEVGWNSFCNEIICVVADQASQEQRVLSRAGMTLERFEAIKRSQMPESKKQQKSDFLINTNCNVSETKDKVLEFIESISLQNDSRL